MPRLARIGVAATGAFGFGTGSEYAASYLVIAGGGGGGVAYSAHVAGFLAGIVLAKPMSAKWARDEADPLVILRRRIG
jgi:membrane associated rhomboid family serine protease